MLNFILPLLISFSAHAGNSCDVITRCNKCKKCEIGREKCVKKAGKNVDKADTCDFNEYVCKTANNCYEKAPVK